MQSSWDFEFVYRKQCGVSDELAVKSDDDDSGACDTNCGSREADFLNCRSLVIEARAIVELTSALPGGK